MVNFSKFRKWVFLANYKTRGVFEVDQSSSRLLWLCNKKNNKPELGNTDIENQSAGKTIILEAGEQNANWGKNQTLHSGLNFTFTFISRMQNGVTELSININLFPKKHKAPKPLCNSMQWGRRHLIPLASSEKSYLHSDSAACRSGIVPELSNTDHFLPKKDHQCLSKGWRLL